LNPWNDEIELSKAPAAPPLKASEKLPLQVTPWSPYLARYGATLAKDLPNQDAVAHKAAEGGNQ
jgi:hypothetical protein